jgi:hypothetical protein
LRGIFVLFRGIEWNLDNVVEVFSYYLWSALRPKIYVELIFKSQKFHNHSPSFGKSILYMKTARKKGLRI